MNSQSNIIVFSGFLKSALKKTLPGIEAHKKMIPKFPQNQPAYFNYSLVLNEAAVLILIFEQRGIHKTVLIERMPDPGPHSGQIAFPGGRREQSDADIVETALREAEEEVGVKIERSNYIGKLTPVQIPISGFSVTPVICSIDFVAKFTMCPKEVKNIFVADLFELLNSETSRRIIVRGMEIDAPCYMLKNKIVWGATAMVLSELNAVISQNSGH